MKTNPSINYDTKSKLIRDLTNTIEVLKLENHNLKNNLNFDLSKQIPVSTIHIEENDSLSLSNNINKQESMYKYKYDLLFTEYKKMTTLNSNMKKNLLLYLDLFCDDYAKYNDSNESLNDLFYDIIDKFKIFIKNNDVNDKLQHQNDNAICYTDRINNIDDDINLKEENIKLKKEVDVLMKYNERYRKEFSVIFNSNSSIEKTDDKDNNENKEHK